MSAWAASAAARAGSGSAPTADAAPRWPPPRRCPTPPGAIGHDLGGHRHRRHQRPRPRGDRSMPAHPAHVQTRTLSSSQATRRPGQRHGEPAALGRAEAAHRPSQPGRRGDERPRPRRPPAGSRRRRPALRPGRAEDRRERDHGQDVGGPQDDGRGRRRVDRDTRVRRTTEITRSGSPSRSGQQVVAGQRDVDGRQRLTEAQAGQRAAPEPGPQRERQPVGPEGQASPSGSSAAARAAGGERRRGRPPGDVDRRSRRGPRAPTRRTPSPPRPARPAFEGAPYIQRRLTLHSGPPGGRSAAGVRDGSDRRRA